MSDLAARQAEEARRARTLRARAVLAVCGLSNDTSEARDMLAALGLTKGDAERARRLRQTGRS